MDVLTATHFTSISLPLFFFGLLFNPTGYSRPSPYRVGCLLEISSYGGVFPGHSGTTGFLVDCAKSFERPTDARLKSRLIFLVSIGKKTKLANVLKGNTVILTKWGHLVKYTKRPIVQFTTKTAAKQHPHRVTLGPIFK